MGPLASYSASMGNKLFLGGLGLLLAAGGMAGAWYFGTGHEVSGQGLLLMVCISLGLAMLGAWCTWGALFMTLLELMPAQLRVPGVFRDTVIARDSITSYRILQVQGYRVLQIRWRSPDGRERRTKVTMLFRPDKTLTQWFAGVPDEDQADMAASLQEVQQDPRLGSTSSERLQSVRSAAKIARLLTFGMSGIAAWALVYPRPYLLLFGLLVSAPLLALWLCWRYQGAFTIDDSGRKSARADLSVLLVMPGFLLGLRALRDANLVDGFDLLRPTVIGVAVLACAVACVAPLYRKKLLKLGLVALLLVPYVASVLAITNARFDSASARPYLVPVLAKHYTSGKGATDYLTVPSWTASRHPYDLQVSPSRYRQTHRGDSVCLEIHPGALGWAWYSVEAAPACPS